MGRSLVCKRVCWGYNLVFSGARQYSEKPGNVVRKLIKNGLKQQDAELYPLRLEKCSFGQSFSKAGIIFNTYSLDENGNYQTTDYVGKTVTPVVDFQSVFEEGYSMLQRYVGEDACDSACEEDYDAGKWEALYKLCQFLVRKGYHETSLKDKGRPPEELLESTETFSAVLLTSHLLSQLMSGDDYIISSEYSDKPKNCPCYNRCGRIMKYGSTGIGFEKLWYGCPDTVLFSRTCISNVLFNENSGELGRSEESTMIDKKDTSEVTEVNHGHCDQQAISQTITFSLYRSDKRGLALVPTLLLSPSSFCVYFYDHVNDVLLRLGLPDSLWDTEDECKFNMSAILKIWMVINHAQFKPSLKENQISRIKNSANFHNLSAKEGLSIKEMSEQIRFKSKFRNYDCHFDLAKRKYDTVEKI